MVFSVTTPYPGTKLWDKALKNKVVNINNLNWDDFVMFYLRDLSRMPKIFYVPDWASEEERHNYWQYFIRKSGELSRRLNEIEGWKKTQTESIERNKMLDLAFSEEIIRRVGREQFISRINRLTNNPVASWKKLIKKPKILLMVIRDFKAMLFG
jgi:hypothetical protein